MFFRYNVMFADLFILSFNGFSKLIPTIYSLFFTHITKRKVYLKVPACDFTLFQNKSACFYDNKHVSKQIPWIDIFQNEKDIQLSLVNIMLFRYRTTLLHWLSSTRSINSLMRVRAWVTTMTCFACQESCFFSHKVSFVVRPNIRMGSHAF